MQKLVLAPNNAGKIREFRGFLASLHFEIITQGELGIPLTEEAHYNFVESALSKARHASAISGLPTLADDSGICCAHALSCELGIHSARYAGIDGDNVVQKLITALQGRTESGRIVFALL